MSDELSDKIDELIFWMKYSVWKSLIADLKVNVRDDIEKLVYELSDGKNSTRDIAELISKGGRQVTHVTVANLWQKWSLIPLVIPTNRSGRYRRVVSLKTTGIEIPPINFEQK